MIITPKLIHPIIIYIAKMVITGEEFNDRWNTRQKGKKLEWNTNEDDLISIQAQLKNEKLASLNQTQGGWVQISKMSFLVNRIDVIGEDGFYKFDKGDQIIRMRDLDMITEVPLKLFVRDVLYRAPYTNFKFIQLVCEKGAPQLV